MDTQNPLYKRVGWPREMMDIEIDIGAINRVLETEDRPDMAKTRRSDPVTRGRLIVIKNYLLEDVATAHLWAKKVLEFADEFFLGEWRDRFQFSKDSSGPHRDDWDKRGGWNLEFEACLLCGSCLGEWDRLAKYAGCLRDDVIRDVEQSKENRAWLLTVAGVLRGQSLEERSEFVEKVRSGRRKREKLLLAWLTAIETGTDEEVAEAAKEYFKHYKRSESKDMDITKKVTIDGTFLVHYARHRGRSIDVPSSVQDHIVELDSAEAPS